MMKYLLDTHTLLWVTENSDKLTDTVISIITDPDAIKYISIASAWEVAIKSSTGKLQLHGGLSEFFRMIHTNNANILPINQQYLEKLANLPFIHKDPFDRLLIATALAEDMSILTADENIHKYNVSWIWGDPAKREETIE